MTKDELRVLNGIYARWERVVSVGMKHPPGSAFLEPIKLRELELRTQLKAFGLEVNSPVWPQPPTELPPLSAVARAA